MPRAAVGALVTACVAVLLAAAAPGKAEAASPCRVRGKAMAGVARSSVVLHRGQVAVYVVRGEEEDRYWACRTRHRGRVLLGPDDSRQAEELYGPNVEVDGIAVQGLWVTATASAGGADHSSCTKYDPTGDCPEGTSDVVVADTASRRRLTLPPAVDRGPAPEGRRVQTVVEDLRAAPGGGLAWVERSTLVAAVGAGPQTPLVPLVRGCLTAPAAAAGVLECAPAPLGAEPVDPRSLAVQGTQVSWTSAGVPRAAALAAPPATPAG